MGNLIIINNNRSLLASKPFKALKMFTVYSHGNLIFVTPKSQPSKLMLYCMYVKVWEIKSSWVQPKPHRNETAAKDISSSSSLQSIRRSHIYFQQTSWVLVNSRALRACNTERTARLSYFIHACAEHTNLSLLLVDYLNYYLNYFKDLILRLICISTSLYKTWFCGSNTNSLI